MRQHNPRGTEGIIGALQVSSPLGGGKRGRRALLDPLVPPAVCLFLLLCEQVRSGASRIHLCPGSRFGSGCTSLSFVFSVSLGADLQAQTRQGCFLALSLLLCWAGAVLWPKAALGCGISVELDAVLT